MLQWSFIVQVYDVIMLVVIGMATIFGAIKGFAWQVASIASILASYLVAYRFRYDVAEMIQATPPWNLFLAMLILYVGTSFVIWVGFRLVSGMIDRVRLKEFDRHLGAGFGLLKGLIYCLLITMFAMSLLGPAQQQAICNSRSGYYIATALDRGVGVLPQEIHDVVGPYLARLDSKLRDGQSQSGQTQNGNSTESPWDTNSGSNWNTQGLPDIPSLGGLPLPNSSPSGNNQQSWGSVADAAQNWVGQQAGQAIERFGDQLQNSQQTTQQTNNSVSGFPPIQPPIYPPQNGPPQNGSLGSSASGGGNGLPLPR